MQIILNHENQKSFSKLNLFKGDSIFCEKSIRNGKCLEKGGKKDNIFI